MANSDGYPWENPDDRLQYPAIFTPTRAEQARMDTALAAPDAPAAQIRAQLMGRLPMFPRYGPVAEQPDILTCWEQPQTVPAHSIMDYTSDEAALLSTSRPSLGQW